MPTVVYDQTLSRQVSVEVTDEELAALRLRSDTNEYYQAVQIVTDRALELIEQQKIEPEFSMAVCMDENDEELFDL